MRRVVPAAAAACLLVGPTVLAFFSGGYFIEPRLVAAMLAWLLVLGLAIVGPAPLPRSAPGWLAVGGLVLITAWSALSVTWTPVRGPAIENVERLVLYVGVLLVAVGVLRQTRTMRAVEPALAAGATAVIVYGLVGRLLPGIVHLAHSDRAGGRLEQPITYWNAEGVLAAVGLVLCARLAGDRTRPMAMRVLAAAAAAPLGAGLYLSYSRGAIAAVVLGLIVLVAAAPSRSQLEAAGILVVTGVAAAVAAAALPGVASLGGDLGARERDGAIMLVIVVLLAAAAAFLTVRRARTAERRSPSEEGLPGSGRLAAVAAVAVILGMAGVVVGGLQEKNAPALGGARAARLTSASSNRYQYWRLGLRAFERHPIEGLGSGGFRVFWLRERSIHESVLEVHSLELEMAAELGTVGLLAFGVMLAGVGLAARRALRAHPLLAAGPCAAAVAWLLHASIDWDWQLPAVSLPVIVLIGALIALSESRLER
jgi:O-antigen ligase